MSTSRRSFFALVGQGIAATMAAAIGTGAAVAEREYVRKPPITPLSTFIDPDVARIIDGMHDALPRGAVMGRWVSTGENYILVDSHEGQAVLNSMAVNLRSDGTLIHRQHHPVDFPPHRE